MILKLIYFLIKKTVTNGESSGSILDGEQDTIDAESFTQNASTSAAVPSLPNTSMRIASPEASHSASSHTDLDDEEHNYPSTSKGLGCRPVSKRAHSSG